MRALEGLKPEAPFFFFEEINNIPRGSGNEKGVNDYIVTVAESKGLKWVRDNEENLVVYKPATKGYEKSPAVIIQGHTDMVCEKEAGSAHDFLKDPLKLYIDGDFIRAKGTTLGADNGLAVAFALAAMVNDDIEHPPLEFVFTSREERGMEGAAVFDTSLVTGKRFLNMDTEEEGKLLAGCCGGRRVVVTLPLEREDVPDGFKPAEIFINGLHGGHSGASINLGYGHATKLLGRILYAALEELGIKIAEITGGLMENAITREASAVVFVHEKNEEALKALVGSFDSAFKKEFRTTDSNVNAGVKTPSKDFKRVFTSECAGKAVSLIIAMPFGVKGMCAEMPGLVETSTNLGIVKTEENSIVYKNAVRSLIESRKISVINEISALAALAGASVSTRGEYPGWEYNPNSELLDICKRVYKNMYGKESDVIIVHMGIECGIFGGKIKGLDMISFGPDIYDVHSPSERMSISSTARVWDYFCEVLKSLK